MVAQGRAPRVTSAGWNRRHHHRHRPEPLGYLAAAASPAGGYESDAMLLTIPMWRPLLGHYLGVLMMPFFLIAIWHLTRIKPAGAWLSIPVAALLGYVAAAGGAFRQHCRPRADRPGGVGTSPETQTVLTRLLADAHLFVEPLQAVVFLAGFTGSVWLGTAILSGPQRIPAGSCSPTRCLSTRSYSPPTFSPPTPSAYCCSPPQPV